MSRAYLRIDPRLFERKVIEQGYPLPLFAAFVAVLCLAEHQPTRGVYRDVRVLRALLGPAGRFVKDLVERCDLVARPDGSLYVDGWEEWQEGDWKVGERVSRIRNRPRTVGSATAVTVATVTNGTEPTVYTPSDGDRQSVIDGGGAGVGGAIPPPPAKRGRRKDGTNPRARGAAPRQNGEAPRQTGTSPRQEREAEKRGGMPTSVSEILRRAAAAGAVGGKG